MFDALPESIEYIRTGKLRPLAVTTATRLEVLPDVPTLGEFVRGYEVSGYYGLGAPRNTPAEIVDKLNREINAARRSQDDGAPRRPGRETATRYAGRLRKAHRRRNREVGQGDSGRQHQSRLIRAANIKSE
jgi:hypothetical protein